MVSPLLTLNLRIEDDVVLSKDFALLKDLYIEWQIPKGDQFEVFSGEFLVLNVMSANVGALSSGRDTFNRHKDNSIAAITKESIVAKDVVSLYTTNVNVTKLIRDIVKAKVAYISPPDTQVLESVYIPKMTRLEALSTLVYTYGCYKSPVFVQYDIDGFHLFAFGKPLPPSLKFAYHINDPSLSSLPKDSIPLRFAAMKCGYQDPSFNTPQHVNIIDYTNSSFASKKSIEVLSKRLGSGRNVFALPGYQWYTNSNQANIVIDEAYLNSVSISCYTDIAVDIRKCKLGQVVSFFTDEVRFKHHQGDYTITNCVYSCALTPRPKVRVELVLSRMEVY